MNEIEDDGYVTVHPPVPTEVAPDQPCSCDSVPWECEPHQPSPEALAELNAQVTELLRVQRIRRIALRVRRSRQALADSMIQDLGGSWDGRLLRWHQLRRLERRIRDRYREVFGE